MAKEFVLDRAKISYDDAQAITQNSLSKHTGATSWTSWNSQKIVPITEPID
jgi:hypothetical protein